MEIAAKFFRCSKLMNSPRKWLAIFDFLNIFQHLFMFFVLQIINTKAVKRAEKKSHLRIKMRTRREQEESKLKSTYKTRCVFTTAFLVSSSWNNFGIKYFFPVTSWDFSAAFNFKALSTKHNWTVGSKIILFFIRKNEFCLEYHPKFYSWAFFILKPLSSRVPSLALEATIFG